MLVKQAYVRPYTSEYIPILIKRIDNARKTIHKNQLLRHLPPSYIQRLNKLRWYEIPALKEQFELLPAKIRKELLKELHRESTHMINKRRHLFIEMDPYTKKQLNKSIRITIPNKSLPNLKNIDTSTQKGLELLRRYNEKRKEFNNYKILTHEFLPKKYWIENVPSHQFGYILSSKNALPSSLLHELGHLEFAMGNHEPLTPEIIEEILRYGQLNNFPRSFMQQASKQLHTHFQKQRNPLMDIAEEIVASQLWDKKWASILNKYGIKPPEPFFGLHHPFYQVALSTHLADKAYKMKLGEYLI